MTPISPQHEETLQMLLAYRNNDAHISLANNGRRCVDGRYTTELGTIARPCGDFGYIMALLAVNKKYNLGLSPEVCVDRVYKAIMEYDTTFFMHTDHHANSAEGSPIIGCGHIAKALNPDLVGLYELDPDELQKALQYVKTLSHVKIVNLLGNHKEEAVVVITGTAKTLNPQSEDHMYFIYDQQRDDNFLQNLVTAMHNSNISYSAMKQAAAIQLHATLHYLAHALPIFAMNVDEPGIEVAFQGIVE